MLRVLGSVPKFLWQTVKHAVPATPIPQPYSTYNYVVKSKLPEPDSIFTSAEFEVVLLRFVESKLDSFELVKSKNNFSNSTTVV